MLSFFPSSTGWQCDWKLFWPPESAIRGRTLWVGGRPKGYFDFFEEKTTYVADWLMVKLEKSSTRMFYSVHDDLRRTGNWVFFKEIFRWVQRAWLHQPQTSLLCSKIELFKRKRLNFQMKTRDERFNDSLIASFPQSDITQFTAPNHGALFICIEPK